MRRILVPLLAVLLAVAAGCSSSGVDWTSPQPLGEVADYGFRPDTDGFSFANYSTSPNGVALSDQDVRELLGDDACDESEEVSPNCKLAPRAAAFQAESRGLVNGGVCEGISVLSLLFYENQRDPNFYGADKPYDLDINNNEPLDRAINRWNSTQLTGQTVDSLDRGSPTQILEKLTKAWESGDEAYTLGMYNLVDGSLKNGHATVPYKIEHTGDGIVRLYIYNSNSPGEEEYVTIDTNDDTWHYHGANIYYDGSADLELAPLSPRLVESFEPRTSDDFKGDARGTAVHCGE